MSRKEPSVSQVASNEFFAITDLIDPAKLQEIQDSFASANGVAVTLTDVDGIPVIKPSNHSKVCNRIRATEKGLARCILSGKQLGQKTIERQKSVYHQCLSIGFTDAAAPIIVNGKHIANWLIGQYHVGNVDEVRAREFALEIGANPEEMIHEFVTMPKIDIQEFEKKLGFLEVMARELSLMGYQNLVQRQQNVELQDIKDQLEQYQQKLEKLVEERTAALQQANQELAEQINQATKMQKRQNRLIAAIECAAESFIITTRSGVIIYVNSAFEKLTGYSREEAIGKTPGVLKSGFHDDNFYQQLWQTILAGEVWTGRFTNKKKDGTFYQEEATISPVKDANSKIVNFVAVKKDITAELELERQLHQAQKLESIGVLAAGLAHELNTPVQYVLSNTNFIKDVLSDLDEMQSCYDTLLDAVAPSGTYTEQLTAITEAKERIDLQELKKEANEAVQQTLEGLDRISTIVSAMRDFAESGPADKRPENLNDLLIHIVDVSRGQWQDHAELEVHLEQSLPLVPLFADRFKMIFLDMIFNAIYALKEKQKLSPSHKGKITITTLNCGDHIELCLADTGTGIPDSIVDKIFDPFFTTKQVGQGSGQGLSSAHKLIVDAHGGAISVSSIEGRGTEFTITLPLD